MVIVNQSKKVVIIDGEVVPFHPKMNGRSITTINDKKCYIDGYELIDGKWKRTFLATWHKFF